ncbi:M-phase phosphoprotein 8 isoform X3 [Brienomyrus brachyistius]|uniref:M-phase phosphoprotein 8 isoform X3 n=1 Tax=Brienomyrus brachyistius TaxID=42636 RepID=UPI0020B29127|nr:M-phase phosphoprotein 8 isoform X3 [Brienomyrus brachyistius]
MEVSSAERTEPGDSEQDEEEDVYEVEKIIDMRTEKGEVLYRVRWKNYTSDDDTWEPESHLEDCREVLLAYRRRLAETKKEAPGKLPMKSDLFDADSESEGGRSKRDESPPKKKKKKKKSKAEAEDVTTEKKKKRRKEKERWKPLPGPESDGNESEVVDNEPVIPSAPLKKTVQTKKRPLVSDEDDEEEEEIIGASKRQTKDKVRDGGKGKKEVRTENKKKKSRRKSEQNVPRVEDEEEAASAVQAEEDLNSEAPSESASMQTDDTTATESCEPPEGPPRSGEEAKAKQKKNKPASLKLQGIKDLIQEKNKKKVQQQASPHEATPPLRESSHQKLKNLMNSRGMAKVKRSVDDDHGLPSSDSSDATTSIQRRGKAKAQEGMAQKTSSSAASSAKAKEPDEQRQDGAGLAFSSALASKKQKESVEKEQSGSTNLFEKFLLNFEAKDRVLRRQTVHVLNSSTETRGEHKIKAAKAEKRTRSVKEVMQNRLELEKAHKEFKGPDASQPTNSPAEAEDRPSRLDHSPEGKEAAEGAKDQVKGRPEGPTEKKDEKPDEVPGRIRTTPDDVWERKGRLEEVRSDRLEKKVPAASPEPAEESLATATGKWKEKKRKQEDGEPRLYMACDDSRETREPTLNTDRGQASLNLGVDLKLDWMTLEDFQKHLNGEDEVLSAATISPSEFREAVKSGDYLAVRLALNSKEDYNLDQEDSSGMSLAMLAAAGGQDDILRLLIKKGARVNGRQKNGSTALMHAAEKNFLTTVAILLEAGAYVNAQTLSGETALMKACKRGNADIVRLLLEYGADCNILSKHQNNAMHFAKLSNNIMVYDHIKDHMATLSSVAEDTIRAYFETRLAVLEPVFPLACHRLCEGPDFSLEFNYKAPPHTPAEGTGILLFIFHANFLSEITARLCGPCSVHAVVLNDKFQLPIFLDSHFIYSFSPVPGLNKLFIRLAESPTAKVKLLICAYRVQLQ